MDLKSLVPFRPRSILAPADLYPFDALRREVDGLFFDFARALGVPSNGATMLAPRIEVTNPIRKSRFPLNCRALSGRTSTFPWTEISLRSVPRKRSRQSRKTRMST